MISLETHLMQFVAVTERTALHAYRMIGCGDAHAADQVAVTHMRQALNTLDIEGRITLGEGERDQAPMLFVGEKVGNGSGGPAIDIALDPLECTTSCAYHKGDALTCLAFGQKDAFLMAPDLYMQKIAVGTEVPQNSLSIEKSATENLHLLRDIKQCSIKDLRVTILERPRHQKIIEEVIRCGAKIKLIQDGDILGAIGTALDKTDLYLGTGGVPEGILAASALKGMGGFMEGRFLIRNQHERERLKATGITEPNKIYQIADMVRYPVYCIATGIIGSEVLPGIKHHGNEMTCTSLVFSSQEKDLRRIERTQYENKS